MIGAGGRLIVLLLVLAMAVVSSAVSGAASLPKMRPYSGIGIVLLQDSVSGTDRGIPFRLYEEPGIFRRGELEETGNSGNEWIFGELQRRIPLIVVARKGAWLKVCYDDAGREAWIDTMYRGEFLTWDQFLKGRFCRLLPGLRKQYYQLLRKPDHDPLAILTPNMLFKVLNVESDWIMIISGQDTIGWLRWRDEDGRLLIGTGSDLKQ